MFLFFYTGFWADWLCSAGPASQPGSQPASRRGRWTPTDESIRFPAVDCCCAVRLFRLPLSPPPTVSLFCLHPVRGRMLRRCEPIMLIQERLRFSSRALHGPVTASLPIYYFGTQTSSSYVRSYSVQFSKGPKGFPVCFLRSWLRVGPILALILERSDACARTRPT